MKSLHNSLDYIQPYYFNSRIILTIIDDYSVLLLIKIVVTHFFIPIIVT